MLFKYKLMLNLALMVLFVGSIIGTGWYAYRYAYLQGKEAGYNKAGIECSEARVRFEAERQEFNKKIFEKIDQLYALSKDLAQAHSIKQQEIKNDIERLRKSAMNKELVIIKDGKCILSKDFMDTYNAIISKGNS